MQAEERGDEDDWIPHPMQHVIGWVADTCQKLEWRVTPREVLQTEREYPGLIGFVALEVWQRHLIKEQLATQVAESGSNEPG